MQPLLQRLQAGDVLICDGAMGTFLQAKGLQPGECPELWCLTHPEEVADIHRSYRAAGSDIVECNSFGGTRFKLAHFGLAERARELNRAAAALARQVAGDTQYVLGSAGPTGELLEPYGTRSESEVYDAYKEQMLGLAEGGADAVIVETMTALEEAALAVRAAREHSPLTVIASFTFDPQARGGYRTMMGVRPAAMAEAMLAAGAHVLGSNCGVGPQHMLAIIQELRAAAPAAPLIAMPNAGMPSIENGRTIFRETPAQMAALVPGLIAAGAGILGGCCGTTPAHIRAMRDAAR